VAAARCMRRKSRSPVPTACMCSVSGGLGRTGDCGPIKKAAALWTAPT
jgi:hypothetical protein